MIKPLLPKSLRVPEVHAKYNSPGVNVTKISETIGYGIEEDDLDNYNALEVFNYEFDDLDIFSKRTITINPKISMNITWVKREKDDHEHKSV